VSFWEEWYREATDSQRRLVLDLACQQGVVLSSQLPPREGSAPKRSLIAELLAGHHVPLEPIHPAPLTPIDPDLDRTQQLAVARALVTPDLALIRGYPGTGKSRLLVELIRQADRLGLRTLFVAATSAGLDRVLEQVGSDSRVRLVRSLAAEESLDALPACVARLTLPGRLHYFETHSLVAARRAVETARATWEARCRDEQTWSRLEGLVERLTSLEAQKEERQGQRPGIRAAVETELQTGRAGSPLHTTWLDSQRRSTEAITQIDTCLAGVRSSIDRVDAERRQCEGELQQLQPLAEARQGGKWWTGSWWRARLHGDVQPRVEELKKQDEQIAERLQSLKREADELGQRRSQAERDLDERRRRLIDAETLHREADLDARLGEVTRQHADVLAACRSGCDALSPGTPRPTEMCRSAFSMARLAWRAQLDRDEQEVQLRQEWLQALEQLLPALPRHLAHTARIIAVTTGCLLDNQKTTGDVPAGGELFDLVVIDEAHRLSEAELHGAARRGRRCVLVGEPPIDVPAAPPRSGPGRSRPAQPRAVFERLWSILHPDPRRLPVRWCLNDDRLVCSLRPLAPEQERWLQREPIFDRPEIEVGIVAVPQQDPQVVEVAFPASTPLEEARAYIYRELDELAVEPAGLSGEWRQDDGIVTLQFDHAGGDCSLLCLGDGVSERLVCAKHAAGSVGRKTAGLEFECAAGWDLDRARAWVEDRLGLCDLGRTTLLACSYRAHKPLARFLSGLLYAGACAEGSAACDLDQARPAVEFIAVPAVTETGRTESRRSEPEARRGGGTATLAPRLRSVRGGAGLEVDLADVPATEQRGAPRRPDLLPGDLRPLLPARGLVNYLEAQAMVSALETLVSDPAFQSASAVWQQRQAAVCEAAAGNGEPATAAPSVAVLCLFPAQVELLGLLVRRSTILAGSNVTVEVGVPGRLAQRECLVALVGLTRSHTHRAVPFSDSPDSLVQALTRAVARLMLFGDPGTLVRRSQWHGALDHLDEWAGPLEQGLITQLLGELTEPEPMREKFRVAIGDERAGRPRESSSV
jgi:hypothetical protein